MAVTVANSNNRLTDADATTGWASDGGGGAGPQNEPDLGYQLTSGSNYAVSRKVGTTKGGHAYTHGSTVDMTAAANQVAILKCVWYNSINAAAYPACGVRVGNDSSNHNEYSVIDDGGQGDLDPDPKRLVYIVVIDPNAGEWPDIITGTVTVSAIDFFGIQGDFGGSAKAENVAMDAIDIADGSGVLWLTGGTPDGTFDDFISHDEGTIANRFGHISTVRPSVFEVFGKLWIGRNATPTATATQFTDSAKTILYGKGFFDVGWTGLGIDLGNASTTVDLTDIVFVGQGQGNDKVYFDTISEVDPTPDEITLSPDPEWPTGTPVVYNNDGGSDSIGLTSGNTYWVEAGATAGDYAIHSSRNNARTAATPIALSDGSSGEAHYLQRAPDIRPELEGTGTSGSFTALRCTFDSWADFVLTTGFTFTSCIFRKCGQIDLTTNNGGVLDECQFTGQTTEPGDALIKTNTLANITDCNFVITGDETGHAIEIDTAGTYTFTGNTFSGYWSSPDVEAGAEFHTQTGVEPTTDVITTDAAHGFSTGDEVYYNDNGGSDTIGLTDGDRYYVDVLSTTTFTLHRSKEQAVNSGTPIALSDGSTGQTQTFYSGKAAIVNTSGGLVTINVGGGGDTPSVRNVGNAASAAVNNNKTVTFTTMKDNSEVRVFLQSTGAEIAGIEDATAGSPGSRTFAWSAAAGTVVNYVIHNFEDGVPVYQTIRVNGFAVPSTDTSIPIQQRLDRNSD